MAELDLSKFEQAAMAALEEAVEDVETAVDGILDEASEDLLSQLHRDSPRRTGEYAAGWAERRESRVGGTVRTIRNEAKPQLTYLLEYGTRAQVADAVKSLLDTCAPGGGYILDTDCCIENAKRENLEAMFETALTYGVY